MALEIVMPRLSDSMEEGTVLRWLVAEGDTVEEGQPLVEIETDKATVTHEAEAAGTVLALVVSAGANVPIGAPIAILGDPGEQLPTARSPEAAAVASEQVSASTSAAASPSAPAAASASAPAAAPAAGARPKASPVARRLAAELQVDLSSVSGTGPDGRVVRADVERAAAGGNGDGPPGPAARAQPPRPPRLAAPAAAGPAPAPAGPSHPKSALAPAAAPAAPAPSAGAAAPPRRSAKGTTTVQPLTRLQRTVARRMSESRATVPDIELRADVDMGEVVALREQLRDLSDPPPSFNDFVVKAAALALREFPRVNGAYRDGRVETYSRVNVGIAVAAPDALVVPTVFDADRASLGEISRIARTRAARVRDGSITPAELSGGTFTVSNLGMFGIDSFSAVINPPQAAILAVGSLKRRAVVDESGAVVGRPTIQLTLACDHRILYGADGARFLSRVRELLERPHRLLL